MPLLIDIKSTAEEPIRFFLNYSQSIRKNLYRQYTRLNEPDRYYDPQRKTVLVTSETRNDEGDTEITIEEWLFEDFITSRFEDEIYLSKGLISETYRTKGDSENSWTYKRLLRAFLKNHERFMIYPDSPERQLLPDAMIEIVTYAMKLYENLLNNPLVPKVKKSIVNSKAIKRETGYKIKTNFWKNIQDFNNQLISAKLIDEATKSSMWYSFFDGHIPLLKINWIGEKPANCLWYFITKLKKDQIINAFPKQQWKHLPDIFKFNGQDIQVDFYKSHNYLDKKSKDKMDKAFDVLKTYTF